ncbi:hypothetical protein FRB90_010235, partial [Tulasnella sp. 427]
MGAQNETDPRIAQTGRREEYDQNHDPGSFILVQDRPRPDSDEESQRRGTAEHARDGEEDLEEDVALHYHLCKWSE